MLDAVLLIAGLALMTYAADRFVLGAARLSTALRISPVIIGALVIGFGTSAPELIVTTLATVQGSQDLAYGNIVGSNTANVLLVLGAAGVMRPMSVAIVTLRREVPLMLVAVVVLAWVAYDLRVTTADAIVLLIAAVAAIGLIVVVGLRDREAASLLEAEVAEFEAATASVRQSTVIAVLGLLGTLAGAQLLVEGAVGLARTIGISEAVIGLTVVAVGTSLPELVTAVAAARRGETELVIGNVLGSNIFNSLPVAGVAGLLATVDLDAAFATSLIVMVASCGLITFFLGTGRRLARSEGAVLLTLFVVVSAVTL